MRRVLGDNRQSFAILVLLGLLLTRVALMIWLPLTDNTEARYAEIARKMLEVGDWVTLQHDYSVPFWGKPPLSTWLAAGSMELLGQSELAVRLPSLLLSLAVLWLTYSLAQQHSGRNVGIAVALILSGSLLFFIASATVMTDPALLFSITLSQVAFWQAVVNRRRLWSYLFFVGLGLGLLAKGPLVVVLAGLPIFFWVLLRRQWTAFWNQLPWIRGTILMLVIALPWYLLAELRTPGFLNYFIIGEHINRFLDSGWGGDKYGFSHSTPLGLVWVYALAALFPWSLALPFLLLRKRHQLASRMPDPDGWLMYLILCALAPLVFFSFSKNIIFPYVLPSLPFCALLFAELWHLVYRDNEKNLLSWISTTSATVIVLLLSWNEYKNPDNLLRTQKPIIAFWQQQHPTENSALVYWGSRREYSAEYYSRGRAKTTQDPDRLLTLIDDPTQDYLVIDADVSPPVPTSIGSYFEEVASFIVNKDHLLLLRERAQVSAPISTNRNLNQ